MGRFDRRAIASVGALLLLPTGSGLVPATVRGSELAVPRRVEPSGPAVRLDTAYGRLPLRFEANQGQADDRVAFLARGRTYSLFLTSGG
jgi:hypothetical protein